MSPRVTGLHLDLFLASLWGNGGPVVLGVTPNKGRGFLCLPRRSTALGSLQFALTSLPETAVLNEGGWLSPSPCLPPGNDVVPWGHLSMSGEDFDSHNWISSSPKKKKVCVCVRAHIYYNL